MLYSIIGNFCGVKFMHFWTKSKKKKLIFCCFFLGFENLAAEKIVRVTGRNK
jgi:hypothetical protein